MNVVSEPKPIRILYMENDPGLARLVQKKLERAGYAVDGPLCSKSIGTKI